MAVPLVNEETSLGVLQVLDRSTDRSFSLERDRPPDPLREPGLDRARPPPDGASGTRGGGARRGIRGGGRPARCAARALGGRGLGTASARGARDGARAPRQVVQRRQNADEAPAAPRRTHPGGRYSAELRRRSPAEQLVTLEVRLLVRAQLRDLLRRGQLVTLEVRLLVRGFSLVVIFSGAVSL